MMDCGWYALNVIRVLMGHQVPDVTSAEAQIWPHDSEIDEGMKATFDFPNGDGLKLFFNAIMMVTVFGENDLHPNRLE